MYGLLYTNKDMSEILFKSIHVSVIVYNHVLEG